MYREAKGGQVGGVPKRGPGFLRELLRKELRTMCINYLTSV